MSLELYWSLSKAEAEERRKAAYELVASLKSSSSSSSSATATNGSLTSDQDYAIQRLVRGLSSSTEAARQGFAACLAEILATLPQVDLSLVKDHMTASTEVTGSLKGHEERDMLLGRLFTCLAVARSGRLKTTKEDGWVIGQTFLESALSIFCRKKVLRSLAGEAVISLLQCMPPKLFCKPENRSHFAKAVGCGIEGTEDLTLEQLNPDQLLLALAIQEYLRQHDLSKDQTLLVSKLPKWLVSKRILKSKRVPKLIEPLKASSASFPQMHPVWDWILKELLADPDENEGALQTLWTQVVDGVLANGTHERKALSMLLLQRACKLVPTAQLPICLSTQVLRTLLSSLSTAGTADQILSPLAKQTLNFLVAMGSEAPEKRLIVGSSLITKCDVNFDQKTGTKTVQSLLDSLSCEDLLKYIRQLAESYDKLDSTVAPTVDDAEEAEEQALGQGLAQKKVWTIDALYALSRSPALGPEGGAVAIDVTTQIIRLLLSLAYFNTESFTAEAAISKKEESGENASSSSSSSWIIVKAPVSPEIRKVAAARLHSLLADLGKKSNLYFTTPEGGTGSLGWLWVAHEAWRGLELHGATLVASLGKTARQAREKMLALVEGLKSSSPTSADGKLSGAFAGLMMQIGLFQLESAASGGGGEGEEEEEDRDDTLGDLCCCYEDLVVKKKKKVAAGDKDEEGDDGEEEVDPIAVLADVCVGALSSSQDGVAVRGLRDIIRKAWALICSSCPLTRPALDVLLSGVCEVSLEGEDGEEGEKESNEDDEEEGDSEDDDMDQDDAGALATLDKALESVGVNATEKESDSSGDDGDGMDENDEEEEEEEIMLDGGDSGELMRVLGEEEDNDHFKAMLALRKKHRQGDKASRLEVERLSLQHRLRTLDLLEVVVTKQHTSPLLLLIISPCIRAVRLLQSQAGPGKPSELLALANRLSSLLGKTLATKARPKLTAADGEVEGAEITEEQVKSIVQGLMSDMRKAASSSQSSLLVSCLIVCTRAVLAGGAAGGAPPAWLAEQYRGLLEDFMTHRSSLTAAPFEQLVTRFSSPACLALLPQLITSSVEASKDFRQAEAFRLIGLLFNQRRVMAPEALAVIEAQLPALMEGLEGVLKAKGGEMNSKRLKPVVECCQAVATYLKVNRGGEKENEKKKGQKKGAAGGGGAGVAAGAAGLAEVLLKVREETGSDAIKTNCANIAKQLRGGEAEPSPSKANGKQKKKREREGEGSEMNGKGGSVEKEKEQGKGGAGGEGKPGKKQKKDKQKKPQ